MAMDEQVAEGANLRVSCQPACRRIESHSCSATAGMLTMSSAAR